MLKERILENDKLDEAYQQQLKENELNETTLTFNTTNKNIEVIEKLAKVSNYPSGLIVSRMIHNLGRFLEGEYPVERVETTRERLQRLVDYMENANWTDASFVGLQVKSVIDVLKELIEEFVK